MIVLTADGADKNHTLLQLQILKYNADFSVCYSVILYLYTIATDYEVLTFATDYFVVCVLMIVLDSRVAGYKKLWSNALVRTAGGPAEVRQPAGD